MKARKLGAALTGIALAGILAGCGGTVVDSQPGAGSPDVGDTAHIFKDLPLAGEALVPYNKDKSVQLRQQFELLASEANSAQVQGEGCQDVLPGSFALANLHWPSLAATSTTGKSSAQVFLAPSDKDVATLLGTIRKQAATCRNATVTFGSHVTKISVKPFAGSACPAGFTQTVTRSGKTQSLDVCFTGKRNALLAVAVADRAQHGMDETLAAYAEDFFVQLGRIYLK